MATATLNADQVFNVGTAGQTARKWNLYDASSAGNVIWTANLSNSPAALTQNQFLRVRANQFTITQPVGAGGETEEGAKRALKGRLGPSTWLALAASDGTVLTNRVELELSEWTIA